VLAQGPQFVFLCFNGICATVQRRPARLRAPKGIIAGQVRQVRSWRCNGSSGPVMDLPILWEAGPVLLPVVMAGTIACLSFTLDAGAGCAWPEG
jgi:hypothetical protein